MSGFKRYVDEHLVRRITSGRSGAYVFELDGARVAKHVCRGELKNDKLWNSYKKEILFYSRFSSSTYSFIPKVYHCVQTDSEIQIIMKKYRQLDRSRMDGSIIEGAMAVLAKIHGMPIPDFLMQGDPKPLFLKSDDISKYMRGWLSVIEEHGHLFPGSELLRVAKNINYVNDKMFSRERRLCHGDFHFDNLLLDDNGDIVVCDWQGVGVGHVSGDISFLLSRLSAEGVNIAKEKAIALYCRHANANITEEEVYIQMSLANLNTSFAFWHEYLHGSSAERVNGVWRKMIADIDTLLAATGAISG